MLDSYSNLDHSSIMQHPLTHHFVDGGDNFQHLLPGDVSIAIQVVHGEGPLQLLLQLAPQHPFHLIVPLKYRRNGQHFVINIPAISAKNLYKKSFLMLQCIVVDCILGG